MVRKWQILAKHRPLRSAINEFFKLRIGGILLALFRLVDALLDLRFCSFNQRLSFITSRQCDHQHGQNDEASVHGFLTNIAAIEFLIHFDGRIVFAGFTDNHCRHASHGGVCGHIVEDHAASTDFGAGANFDTTENLGTRA